MLPFDDLGDDVPPLLVVGRETALATGYADVVAVDKDGLVTVIETNLRQALLAELNALPGIALRPDATSKRPSFPLSALLSAETQRGLLTAMEGVVGRLRAKMRP